MYCPNCELEIKGEEKNECPICNSPLVESPFETAREEQGDADTELKLKELIKDIDEKVSRDMSGEPGEDAFKLESFNIDGEGPSEKEFDIGQDELKEAALAESSEDEVFVLNEEKEGAAAEAADVSAPDESTELQDEIPEPLFELKDAGLETPPPEQTISEPAAFEESAAEQPLDEPPAEPGTTDTIMDFDDTVELSRSAFQESIKKEELSTKAILDKALDDLSEEEPLQAPPKKKSLALPVLLGVVLLLVVAGAGMYILNIKQEPVPAPPVTTVRKALPPARKPPQKAKQAPAPQQVSVDVEKKTVTSEQKAPPASAPAEKPAPPAQKTEQQPAVKAVEPPVAAKAPDVVKKAEAPPEEQPMTKQSPPVAAASNVTKEPVQKKEAPPAPAPVLKKEAPAAEEISGPVAGTYSVHAGSYRTQQTAAGEAKRLKGNGFDAYIEKVNLGANGIWFRVKIGNYATSGEAKKIEKEIIRKEKLKTLILKNK